jgi:hypothetical protein
VVTEVASGVAKAGASEGMWVLWSALATAAAMVPWLVKVLAEGLATVLGQAWAQACEQGWARALPWAMAKVRGLDLA